MSENATSKDGCVPASPEAAVEKVVVDETSLANEPPSSPPVGAPIVPDANQDDPPHYLDGRGTTPVELIFGLVGPIGVDLAAVRDSLTTQLNECGYEAVDIRLSDVIPHLGSKPVNRKNEFLRIDSLIKDGNALRQHSGEADIVGRLGLTAIRDKRREISGAKDEPSKKRAVAYIIRSFKRKEEIELFRKTYGRAFTLISVYSPEVNRMQALSRRFRGSNPEDITDFGPDVKPEVLAVHIMERDYQEANEDYGQRVGKAFPLADFFVTTEPRKALDDQLRRLVRLTLGDPYISPSKDEQGMFFAQAAALRSLDLSRQVGAAITSNSGDVLATGCNEVPKFGGGLYWADDVHCSRDLEMGEDANVAIKKELVEDALALLKKNGFLNDKFKDTSEKDLAESILFGKEGFFKNSKLFDVIEFGRALHAEMAAITQAATQGTSIKNARLYCTTFPCHICARHIVAAGISDVFFIEPYEKSRTADLYPDSIVIEPHVLSPSHSNFRAFVGVAPRRYMEYFQMSRDRKSEDGKTINLATTARKPKFERLIFSYIAVEKIFISEVERLLAKAKANIQAAEQT